MRQSDPRNPRENLSKAQRNGPVDDSSVYNLQNDDPLCAVFEEIGHFLLQRRLHLVLGYDLEVIPRRFAPPLHLEQVVLELIKVHLKKKKPGRLTVTSERPSKMKKKKKPFGGEPWSDG